ncbi:hypothetical protein LUZ63_011529 [Rhynchospora breviuscula]|uniref:Methyltransferase-like protein n=1 Tax=Rhynchospora breviuscula TaxID=2022672 RepID=A0A9Q0CJ00_9POAL|nr:hypothetical protein LUZ63_011529 [Rhynchospora breviuscula]
MIGPPIWILEIQMRFALIATLASDLDVFDPIPQTLSDLLDPNNGLDSRHFIDNIRIYNSMFAFTSMGVQIDESGRGPYERRYLLKEFPELLSCHDSVKVLEVGCGNGSTVLPILRARESVVVYACDCSEEILEKAKEIVVTAKSITPKNRFVPFVLDFNNNEFPEWLFCTSCQSSSTSANNASSDNWHENEASVKSSQKVTDYAHENETSINSLFLEGNRCCVGGVDFVTLIFTLSAVPFCKMPSIIQKCSSVLKPGGLILFRDYGVYDMTMLRFAPVQKVGFREYFRSDGTLSYFFSLDITRDLFCAAGLIELELEYCCVRSVNRRNGKEMRRVWVHGKFQKPIV